MLSVFWMLLLMMRGGSYEVLFDGMVSVLFLVFLIGNLLLMLVGYSWTVRILYQSLFAFRLAKFFHGK